MFRLPWPRVALSHISTTESSIQSRGAGMRGHTAEQTDCTMLFVDGGFPIDVIFYASVWGRERERRESRVSEHIVRLCILIF